MSRRRRALLAALAFFAASVSLACAAEQVGVWPPDSTPNAGKPKNVVVLAGDSRIDPGGGSFKPSETWPYVLAQIDPFFANALKFNFATSRYRTSDVLKQFDEGVFDAPIKQRPAPLRAYMLIWIGINDVIEHGDAAVIYQNLNPNLELAVLG